MASKAEQMLKKIRKLESNFLCVNCHTPAPKGIGTSHYIFYSFQQL